jgi:hypothetical protein
MERFLQRKRLFLAETAASRYNQDVSEKYVRKEETADEASGSFFKPNENVAR